MDPSLLAPELSMVGVAIAVILLDLVVKQKALLAYASVIGLGAPLAFSIILWDSHTSGFAGTLLVDNFAVFFKFLFIGSAALVILSSIDYAKKFARFQGEYYALILLATSGMMLMASTGELISIFIAMELASLSQYVLVGFLKNERSVEASLKYLLLGAVASAVMLYGMALIFGLTGTTNLSAIAAALQERAVTFVDSPALILGMVLLVAGFGFKMAAVPFQAWIPDVYQGAPTPVTAFLSVASKIAGFAVVLRVFYVAFPAFDTDWQLLFGVLAAVSMTLGNLVAVQQSDIKRMLGYSSIAQAGFVMVGLATLGEVGQSRVLFYLAAYAFTNLAAFVAIIAISNRTGSDEIDDFAGMVRRSPVLAGGLALALISLTGIPPSVGFFAKFFLFQAAIDNGYAWLVLIAVVNSVVSAYYYLRPVKAMFLREPTTTEPIAPPWQLSSAAAVSTLGVLFFGMYPTPLLRLAEIAVSTFG